MGISFLKKSKIKLTTIGQRQNVIAYCWADGKLLFFILPTSLSGAGLSKYDNGTYTKHLHKTNIFDGRN